MIFAQTRASISLTNRSETLAIFGLVRVPHVRKLAYLFPTRKEAIFGPIREYTLPAITISISHMTKIHSRDFPGGGGSPGRNRSDIWAYKRAYIAG